MLSVRLPLGVSLLLLIGVRRLGVTMFVKFCLDHISVANTPLVSPRISTLLVVFVANAPKLYGRAPGVHAPRSFLIVVSIDSTRLGRALSLYYIVLASSRCVKLHMISCSLLPSPSSPQYFYWNEEWPRQCYLDSSQAPPDRRTAE